MNWRDRPPVGLVTSQTQRSHKNPGAETNLDHQSHQRPVLVSAGASPIPFSRTRAASTCATFLSWCGILHVQCNSSTFQGCRWGEYSTVKPQQQEFPLDCRRYFIICPWISKVYIELDWVQVTSRREEHFPWPTEPDPHLFPASSWVHQVLLPSSSYDRFTEWHKIINSQLISCC